MSLLETDFLLPEDRDMVRRIGEMILRAWGDHERSLVDCVTYYTFVLDKIRGSAITDAPCVGNVDLRLAGEIVGLFPGRVRDFRLLWSEDSTVSAEFDLYKDGGGDPRTYPDIEWVEHDRTVFERRLEEEKISHLQQPAYWSEVLPVLSALVKTIYNKSQHHPTYGVKLGVEPKTCVLIFSNMDHINYAVLSRLAEQAHILDITVRAWEKRLDIRIKDGGATPVPDRSLPPKKHKEQVDDPNTRSAKRQRKG
jgi:hypothetical protein